eukprot:716960_1
MLICAGVSSWSTQHLVSLCNPSFAVRRDWYDPICLQWSVVAPRSVTRFGWYDPTQPGFDWYDPINLQRFLHGPTFVCLFITLLVSGGSYYHFLSEYHSSSYYTLSIYALSHLTHCVAP